jgi:rhodanese-related sulfurtransferase
MNWGARGILLEAAVVLAAGLLAGVAANFLSPRGLALGRDYFPKVAAPAPLPAIRANAPQLAPAAAETNAVFARLRARGLQPLPHADVVALFRDPKCLAELILFVDVRNDEHYAAGHIPGAQHFDYYRPQDGLAAVLSACGTAEKIVVYCNGGECEDSELAALLLGQGGVPRDRIFVYPGGFAEWSTNRLPVEVGARGSGVMKEAAK